MVENEMAPETAMYASNTLEVAVFYGHHSLSVKPIHHLPLHDYRRQPAARGSWFRSARRGRKFCAAALTLLAVGCASGPAARPARDAVGPAPADAQLVVTVRQPLLDDLFAHFDMNALLPPDLQTDVDTLSASTDRLVLGLRPGDRGATLALVPAGRYPAQLMGW